MKVATSLAASVLVLALAACDGAITEPDVASPNPAEVGAFGQPENPKALILPVVGLFDASPSTITNPGKSWIDGKGILHIRRQLLASPTTGDLVGTTHQVSNLDVDPVTGNGRAWGQFAIVGQCAACPGQPSGRIRGRFRSVITGGVVSGKFRGSGKLGPYEAFVLGTLQQISGPDPVFFAYEAELKLFP